MTRLEQEGMTRLEQEGWDDLEPTEVINLAIARLRKTTEHAEELKTSSKRLSEVSVSLEEGIDTILKKFLSEHPSSR